MDTLSSLYCLYFEKVGFIPPNKWLSFFEKSAGIVAPLTMYKCYRKLLVTS